MIEDVSGLQQFSWHLPTTNPCAGGVPFDLRSQANERRSQPVARITLRRQRSGSRVIHKKRRKPNRDTGSAAQLAFQRI